MKKRIIVATLLCGFILGNAMPKVNAGVITSILKTGGVAVLVDRYAGDLNVFINKLTAKYSISDEYATKVVPIIAVGSKGYVGAAQVSGPKSAVDRTQAALALEGDFMNRSFRIQALIPMDSKNPTSFNRVQGVGVSAKIDIAI